MANKAKDRKTTWELIKPQLKKIGALYGSGMTRGQICDAIGICENTFRTHEKNHKELAQTMKQARAKVLHTLAGKLYELATGATRKTQTISNGKLIETVEVLPPSLPAILALGKILAKEWIVGETPQGIESLTNDEMRERACRMLGIPNTGDKSTSADEFIPPNPFAVSQHALNEDE